VTGVECDAGLAADARTALAAAGLAGQAEVVVADLFAPGLLAGLAPVDVLFSYLSPATLQRLTPMLREGSAGDRRLVAVDFAVPDLVADEEQGPAHLYRLPGRWRRARPRLAGWPLDGAGTLCIAPSDVSSLTCLTAIHAGGPVRLTASGPVTRHASIAAGADGAPPGRPVAVDIRWRPRPTGTLASGEICVDGLPVHPLTVLFAEAEFGQWNLTEDGCEALAERLHRRDLPPPLHAADLLDAL
jgi:hypothetical protein